jgi:hypothetical protein
MRLVVSASLQMHIYLAYLDPGSGSMLIQAIAGGSAAVAVTGRIYWRRLLRFLRIRKPDDDESTGE